MMMLKTKLIALSVVSLGLAACDMEQRPESAADRGGTEMVRPGGPGSTGAPMTPPTSPAVPQTPASPGGTPSSGAAPAN